MRNKRLIMYLKGLGILTLILLFSGNLWATETGEKVVVGNKTCPVSGEKIDEGSAVTYEYKGKVYSFCCEGCVEEFKKDPERYIEKMEKPRDDRDGEKHHRHHH
ncbi:MAG: YHS domain-containing protein [Thermodesulfovibrionales bacterium]